MTFIIIINKVTQNKTSNKYMYITSFTFSTDSFYQNLSFHPIKPPQNLIMDKLFMVVIFLMLSMNKLSYLNSMFIYFYSSITLMVLYNLCLECLYNLSLYFFEIKQFILVRTLSHPPSLYFFLLLMVSLVEILFIHFLLIFPLIQNFLFIMQ